MHFAPTISESNQRKRFVIIAIEPQVLTSKTFN